MANNSNTGLAVKDLSKVKAKSINMRGVKFCIDAFQKKQEFGGAKIILNKNIYCKVNVDEFSKLNLLF